MPRLCPPGRRAALLRLNALLLLLALPPAAVRAQQPATPEATVRAFYLALFGHDQAAFEALTLPHAQRAHLFAGSSANEAARQALAGDPEALQLYETRPLRAGGRTATAGPDGSYPDGTTGLYVAAYAGNPAVVRLTFTDEGWKVDLRWWIALIELVQGGEATDSPAAAARALTAALVRLDRAAAARYAVPGTDLDLLFAGAPSSPEPSDQLDALVYGMPLAELAPGEVVLMPTGRLFETPAHPDVKVLLGLLGSLEVPYVLRRHDGAWKVVGEPYFKLLLQ